jgi:hypothetical protein
VGPFGRCGVGNYLRNWACVGLLVDGGLVKLWFCFW